MIVNSDVKIMKQVSYFLWKLEEEWIMIKDLK